MKGINEVNHLLAKFARLSRRSRQEFLLQLNAFLMMSPSRQKELRAQWEAQADATHEPPARR